MSAPLTVAVTGLNATDNPGPGVGVIRSLRYHRDDVRVIGLAYDALEPGVYADGLVSDVYLIPYPSQGIEPLRERLAYIRAAPASTSSSPPSTPSSRASSGSRPSSPATASARSCPPASSSTCAARPSSTSSETAASRCPPRACSAASPSSTRCTRSCPSPSW
ncbi:MAG: hypothetical protein R3A52_25690 [Polyangiales bacterium]